MIDTALTFCGQPLSPKELDLIHQCLKRYPGLSREEIAATVCEWLDWRRPNGKLKTRECRDLLLKINAPTLPPLQASKARGPTQVPKTSRGEPQAPLDCALQKVQPLKLRRVEQPDEARWWRELIGRYHYLGYRTAYGASLRYLIETSSPEPRTLGCLQFSSPAWRMQARDLWIGWDDGHRRQNLPRLINNSRFLILPWVHIPNLASHVLALAMKAAPSDWESLFGLKPWLAETLVDSARFSGHCYRAANWIDVGLTTGRGRQDREHARHGEAPKRILLYPLHSNSQQLLRR